MKIIHVAYSAERYGIGTFLLSLLSQQIGESNNMKDAIVFNIAGMDIQRFQDLGIKVHLLNKISARNIWIVFKYLKIFKKYNIINLHGYSPWAFLAGMLLRKKIVYTFHGALGLRSGAMDVIVKQFHKIFLNNYCLKIVFASQASLNRYLDGFDCRMNPKKMVIFPYGMKIDKIKAQVTRIEMRNQLGLAGKFVIATAARMDPYKRIERLLEAFAFIPDPTHFKLVIMGEGDQNYKKFLNNEVKRLKIEKYVLFLGFRSDVLDVVSAMDLFVLPTKNEAFGLALLEAMALGTPCAVFNDGGGTVDIIDDSGFVVKDAKELSEKIMKLHQNPELAASISFKVKKRAQKFDIKFTAEKLAEIYEEAMS